MKSMIEPDRDDDNHLPAWILEALAFGAEVADGRPSTDEKNHLASCERCQGIVSRLRAERHRFAAAHPEALFFARVRRRQTATGRPTRVARDWPTPKGWRLGACSAALASVLLFVVPLWVSDPGSVKPTIRMRGQAPPSLHLFVSREGRIAEPVGKGHVLRAGDVIRFGVRTWTAGYIYVVNLDEKRRFSLYYPPPTADGPRSYAARDEIQLLPGSVELDDYVGREALYLLVSQRPLSTAMVERAFVEGGGSKVFPPPEKIDLSAQIVRLVIFKE